MKFALVLICAILCLHADAILGQEGDELDELVGQEGAAELLGQTETDVDELAGVQEGVCVKDAGCANSNGLQPCPAPDPGQMDNPDVYPSLHMRRYSFISNFYPVLRLLADAYFTLVDAAFTLYNAFQPAGTVTWKSYNKLLMIPAHEVAKMIRDKKMKSADIVAAYIARVKEVNESLNVVAHKNYDAALKLAAECDAKIAKMNDDERAQLAKTKPMFGVPFTSKDNLLTLGFPTYAGNQWRFDHPKVATRDADVVKRMKDAGGVLIAVSMAAGFAWSCDNTALGVASNPHDTRRTTGGSSSGEGALTSSAASLCGIGNDIGGSIRIPSNMCGVFGIKPTHGQPGKPDRVVSIDGIVPEEIATVPNAGAMLTNGPLCRYASDLPLALSILAGKGIETYDIKVDFAKKFRIYYMEDLNVLVSQNLQPEQRGAVRKVRNYFESKYNLTVQKVDFPLMSRFIEMFSIAPWSDGVLSIREMANMYLDVYGGGSNYTFLQWQFEVLKGFVTPKDDVELAFVKAKKQKLLHQLSTLLGKDGVLVTPAWPTEVPWHHMEPWTGPNLDYTMLFNVLGYPALTAPVGKSPTTGMPLGVQVVGAPFNEALLIAVGRELEKAFGGWVVPGKMPTESTGVLPNASAG